MSRTPTRVCSLLLVVITLTALLCISPWQPASASSAHDVSASSPASSFLTVGNIVTFGSYNTFVRKDPIEWLVLDYDSKNDKALIISRYGLECGPYNINSTDVTWETCTLRSWLNAGFLNEAFNEVEQRAILTTTVDNSKSQGYSDSETSGGNNTQDKVFLLSYAEAKRYFKGDDARMCKATMHAVNLGAKRESDIIRDGKDTVRWWLRSPDSYDQNRAMFVYYDGSIRAHGLGAVYLSDYCIRPALWVDLNAEHFKSRDDHIETSVQNSSISSFKTVGNIVTFGIYPQTSSGTDKTPIEWLVLDYDSKNNKALLISRYALDCKPYNTTVPAVSWEACTLRTWLNKDFLNKAFGIAEQVAILTTAVDNSKSQGFGNYRADDGSNTQDKVFLLSNAEALRYFTSNDAHMCAPTDYAIKQGAFTASNKKDDRATGWWWLRSLSKSKYHAAVDADGILLENSVYDKSISVRPALWINLNADIF